MQRVTRSVLGLPVGLEAVTEQGECGAGCSRGYEVQHSLAARERHHKRGSGSGLTPYPSLAESASADV
jgi:hypothetical protein